MRSLILMLFAGLSLVHAVDFAEEIQPFLEQKCLRCHNPNQSEGDLSLATADAVLDPKKGWVTPGNGAASRLHAVTIPDAPGKQPEMPDDDGEPLTAEEALLLRQWIDEGAAWPEGLVLHEAAKTDKQWWAYQKLRHPEKDSIDAYIDEALAAQGLQRNPPASPRTLIRRATYDLVGLPPTPEEVHTFVAAHREDPTRAYEALIDRLLDSPHYGESWGRHWLDVVRFGESNGFERNVIINSLWPFRDYVIRSINGDKPFDQFIREHLAGDVFGMDDPEVAIGSAFLVAGPFDDVGNQDPVAQAQIRANTLDEIINATGEAFLGMTLGCARCHDHKFDPIAQRDYYQLYATFAGIRHGESTLATPDERKAHAAAMHPLTEKRATLQAEMAALTDGILDRARERKGHYESQWTRPPVDRRFTEERFAPVDARFVRLVCEAQDSNPGARRFNIDEFEIWSADKEPKNVALAANGGRAEGEARRIEDFRDAYSAGLAIDGQFGARFISASDTLMIELATPTEIDRVVFSSARGSEVPHQGKFTFVADYRIETSLDGERWQEVAHGRDRQPVNDAHRHHRMLFQERTPEEEQEQQRLARALNKVNRAIDRVPPLRRVFLGHRHEDDVRGPFHLFLGGDPQRRGERVTPASLSTLSEVLPSYVLDEDASEAARRVALADWVTHPQNPLTWRVLVNRLWHYHFGVGIVTTPNDFGYMGGRPSHPELLDFLASKLRESGWRLKPIHRLIMLSQTYQQASTWHAEAARIDSEARLLWRFPTRRLSAEEIRDSMLVVAGKLDRTAGGPGFRLYRFLQDNVSTYVPLDHHGPETYRRAVYHQNVRAAVVDLMTEYDQPDCAFSAPRRSVTTTPLQALTSLNHTFTIDMAEALAARLSAPDEPASIHELYKIIYQRSPTSEERAWLAQTAAAAGWRAVCRALLNSSEFLYLD